MFASPANMMSLHVFFSSLTRGPRGGVRRRRSFGGGDESETDCSGGAKIKQVERDSGGVSRIGCGGVVYLSLAISPSLKQVYLSLLWRCLSLSRHLSITKASFLLWLRFFSNVKVND
ncbi:hypothetical protein HA466_0031600 [Hirschfeldia incana]|nr:hypothetical protein HA466_0031600 [Hirschfeldia incana]